MHWEVAFSRTVEGLQATATDVIVGAADWTAMDVVPVVVVFWVLVAVMVTATGDDGAVKSPLALMVPALAVQVTAEL